MKWEGHETSANVEDARGRSGGPGLIPGGGRSIGLGAVVVALVAGWMLGISPLQILGWMSGGNMAVPSVTEGSQGSGGDTAQAPPASDTDAQMVSVIVKDTEEVWGALFEQAKQKYTPPTVTLYSGSYPTACGMGNAAMGPFYCPGDRHVYLDLGFFQELSQRYGAPGDFARAYVIAHEIGHHIQHLEGTTQDVQDAGRSMNAIQKNKISVKVELQADCYAGVWAARSQKGKGWLEEGDLQEAIQAASRIGDDVLQRESTGQVRPDSFTHGTAQQRMQWFKVGYDSGGNPTVCDTFSAKGL